jgi:hypothetical protein
MSSRSKATSPTALKPLYPLLRILNIYYLEKIALTYKVYQ